LLASKRRGARENVLVNDLITTTASGLYCERGDFYIDPWRPVPRAVITHAHADHARWGSERYLTSEDGRRVLQSRMGATAVIDSVAYGETIDSHGVKISLHPAGHILGSSQIRVEYAGEVWVVSGDYKVAPDNTCRPFESVQCHTFVTECTFGLPIYRWQAEQEIVTQVNAWWQKNRDDGRACVVFAYALGKAQRIIAGLDASIGPIYCHGAVERINNDYRATGVSLPPTQYAGRGNERRDWSGSIVVAPPSSIASPWLKKFGAASTAFASGWMRIRGARRRRSVERGFVLSDHADWPGLTAAILATGAERVFATHGRTTAMVRWLRERGINAAPLSTEFVGESDDAEVDVVDADEDQPRAPIEGQASPDEAPS
jgi:putative mRNA 3-end processing factor